jgi:hypothetical protein
MNYLFSFSFAFDDPDHPEGDRKVIDMCFLLDEAATARTGYTKPNMAREQPEPFNNWFAETAENLEEEFNAVHDYSGTHDEETLIEGFCTYEIETIEMAHELMRRWRRAFVEFLGEQGVGPVVDIPIGAHDHTSKNFTSELRDLVMRLSTPVASPRP